jgi:hypothetical protein
MGLPKKTKLVGCRIEEIFTCSAFEEDSAEPLAKAFD